MSDRSEDVERGDSEEATRVPLTPAEVETSKRPAGVTPGATPGWEDEDGEPRDVDDDEGVRAFKRSKELNPDDFE
jgi:hypothetical protein